MENIGNFEKVDIKGTFTVSKEQMSILNGVLKNIRNLCLSLGCIGSAQLFDYKGMPVLKWCDVEYALENDAVYKDNKKIVDKEADMVKSYIEKTISLIEKYISMPVKSITFAVYEGSLKEGRFARAIDEPSSLAFILR